MKFNKAAAMLLSATVGLCAPALSIADGPETEDSVERSAGEQKVTDKIINDFTAFAGDDAGTIVSSLRHGENLSYELEVERGVVDTDGNPVLIDVVDADGNPVLDANNNPVQEQATELALETVTAENTNGTMGFGEVTLSMALAEKLLGDGATLGEISRALFGNDTDQGIIDMRAEGKGWGEIFASYDLKVGEVIRSLKAAGRTLPDQVLANRQDKARGKLSRSERAKRPKKALRLGKAERPERSGKAERPDKASRPEKMERPEKVERPEKPERPEKVERPERPERPEKIERPERPERPEKVERPERPERPEKVERPSRP